MRGLSRSKLVIAIGGFCVLTYRTFPSQDRPPPSSSPLCGAAADDFSVASVPAAAAVPPRQMEDLAAWYAGPQGALLRRMYLVEQSISHTRVPAAMSRKLQRQGRDPRAFERQLSIGISSRLVPADSLAFNRVRAQRFGATATGTASSAALTDEMRGLACGQSASSDFCDPSNLTMVDERVGYLSNAEAVAFANMGRLTALHAVVASRRFVHPLQMRRAEVVAMETEPVPEPEPLPLTLILTLTRAEVVAMVSLARTWFTRVHAAYSSDGERYFPTFTFDLLRNGGASQTHPHLQPHLTPRRYPGKWEALHQAPHHSPLTTHHSPLTTHRSPLTTNHSPLTAYRLPLTT